MDPTTIIIVIIVALVVISLIARGAIVRRRRQLVENGAQQPMELPPMAQQQFGEPSPFVLPPPSPTPQQPFVLPPPPTVAPSLFKPIGKVPYQPSQPLPKMQVQKPYTGSPTQDFTPRGTDKTLKGTCFLTGKPRSTCVCDECKKKRGSK